MYNDKFLVFYTHWMYGKQEYSDTWSSLVVVYETNEENLTWVSKIDVNLFFFFFIQLKNEFRKLNGEGV